MKPNIRAGVVIDEWKLSILKKHLDASGLSYTQSGGISPGTILFAVLCHDVEEVNVMTRAANDECRRSKQ